jgi:predicted lipid-binding transport protein (Tim44 family)
MLGHGGENMKKAMLVVLCVLILAGAAFAQRPARRAGHGRHPNIAAAERLSRQAVAKVVAAQRANEWDLGGHAQKAKDLLEQANTELKAAAEAANEGKK